MKKVIGILLMVNLTWGFWGFESFDKLDSTEANQTVDELSFRSKIILGLMSAFMRESEPMFKELEENLTKSFTDINSSMEQFGYQISILTKELVNSLNDANSTNRSILNYEQSSINKAKNDMKSIISLNEELIEFAEISRDGDKFEVDIYGLKEINRAEFSVLANDSADIIRQNHNIDEKVRVYYFSNTVKYSGLF
ncbi:MAG: hypothetical protein GXZ15_03135 [Campylobacter sp.]|nr:hypothetical protein [Campylobacter sp.]